jgi:hypothetical protein
MFLGGSGALDLGFLGSFPLEDLFRGDFSRVFSSHQQQASHHNSPDTWGSLEAIRFIDSLVVTPSPFMGPPGDIDSDAQICRTRNQRCQVGA